MNDPAPESRVQLARAARRSNEQIQRDSWRTPRHIHEVVWNPDLYRYRFTPRAWTVLEETWGGSGYRPARSVAARLGWESRQVRESLDDAVRLAHHLYYVVRPLKEAWKAKESARAHKRAGLTLTRDEERAIRRAFTKEERRILHTDRYEKRGRPRGPEDDEQRVLDAMNMLIERDAGARTRMDWLDRLASESGLSKRRVQALLGYAIKPSRPGRTPREDSRYGTEPELDALLGEGADPGRAN
jgi:hypothetical protein